MRKDKPTFITIIILFIVFLGLSIYGGILKSNIEGGNSSDNINKEFFYSGSLYFYDENSDLLGTYTCSSEVCGYATSSEEEYLENYYVSDEKIDLGIINDDYVLLIDGENIILYSISLNMSVLTFEEVKYYDTYNSENYILVKLDGKWGALSIDNFSRNIEIMYDELSLADNTVNDVLDGSILYAKFNEEYFIIDSKNNVLSEKFTSKIVDYTSEYIITYDEEIYSVYDYEGNKLINYDFSYYTKSDSYYAFVYNNYLLVYSDLLEKYIELINIGEYTEITIEDFENSYKIYIDGQEF